MAETGLSHEILEIVRRVNAPARHAQAARAPVVISFVPSAGASAIPRSLSKPLSSWSGTRREGRQGRARGLDFQSSHVCDYLDIAPKFQFDEIVGTPERLDDQLMGAFISRHPSGLDVFAASRSRLHARDLGVEALSALFDRMTERYAFIVIDLPLSVHAWTIPLLAASKGILVTGFNTIPGLRQIEETIRALREEASITADVRAVVNRCELASWVNLPAPSTSPDSR